MAPRTLALSISMTLVVLISFCIFMNPLEIRQNRRIEDDPDTQPFIFRPETTEEDEYVNPNDYKVLTDINTDVSGYDTGKDEEPLPQTGILFDWENDRIVHNCSDGSVLKRYGNLNTRDLSPNYEPSAENDAHRKRSFTDIFENGKWSHKESEGVLVVSGPGSLYENTVNIRRILNSLIGEIKLALGKDTVRMLDIPCGDFTWMRRFLSERDDVMYTGMDIVPGLIASHTEEFKDKANIKFINQDIVSESLPEQFDLILSRHMTIHLTNADTLKVLHHFSENNHGYLLMTTYPVKDHNKELDVDKHRRFRCQNLEKEPFSLPPPLCQDTDAFEGFDVAALWRLPLKQTVE